MDNLIAAAALGRLDLVEREFDARGRLRPDAQPHTDVFGHSFADPDEMLECAFFLACRHGRLAIAKFLLRRGVHVRELLERIRDEC
ncbi:MAG: hypothetical protein HY812_05990 [Planctomycetes bacterium]|nr:hypothetical protein [Planctomycetota bacterium]